VPPVDELRCALGYLATYAADRQAGVERLLLEPARRRPRERFLVVGSLYPDEISWPPNVERRWHLGPSEHPAFYCSCRLTLNVTRQPMLGVGYSPSGRLFEASACGSPLLSDWWPGLDELFTPGDEILIARSTDDALAALDLDDAELRRIAARARERTLAEHTGEARAAELLAYCDGALSPREGERQPSLTRRE
jgi:spore maturation protein CgeB